MTDPAFTILLPVHRPPALLPFAVASVQAQERQDFELFIICDGAPPETVACAEELAGRDSRIRVFAHPKGARSGEAYRHQALQFAQGRYVCHIGDDDLWLPNHLSEMESLLTDVDFGNLLHVEADTDGEVALVAGDLANPQTRQRMLERTFNIFGLTVGGYRLSAYRALPVGWSPAPPGLASDLHMWRRFLAQGDLRFGTRSAVTSVKFAASCRSGWTMEQRALEMAAWVEKLATPGGEAAVVRKAFHRLNVMYDDTHREANRLQALLQDRGQQVARLRGKLRALRGNWSWRLTRPVRKLARLLRGKT